ncbi:SipW-cognate class signal peptide [Blastococcus fimeti]|nr:SipW-cognate class signal peptide [Blastococcus fimeti]
MSAKVTSSTARKVIGSLGVIGAAAAVAGMGTFGSFTDSTTAVNTTISSGTVKISAAQPAGAVAMNASNLVPGDTMTRAINVANTGTTDFGSIMLQSTVATPSVLTTDAINGLQLAVKSCAVAWTQGGTAQAPTYTCSNGERLLGSSRAVNNLELTNPYSLTSGKTDYLAVSISLPTSADNAFQGKSADLSLVFTAQQRTAGVR